MAFTLHVYYLTFISRCGGAGGGFVILKPLDTIEKTQYCDAKTNIGVTTFLSVTPLDILTRASG